MQRIKLALCFSAALTAAACSTLQPVTAPGVSRAIGRELPGAQGKTLKDQDRIDDTVARSCAAGLYALALCDLHTKASAARRAELPHTRQEGGNV